MKSTTFVKIAARDPMCNDNLPWSAQEDALLGTDVDRVVAQRIGRSSVACSNRRKVLGIPPARPRTQFKRTLADNGAARASA